MLPFEDCFSLTQLERNFAGLLYGHLDVVRNTHRIARGSDRVELDSFRRDLSKHLRAASRKAIQGRYTFAPFLEHEKPKDDGGTRVISISTIRDNVVQRALYDYLYDAVDAQLSDCVFGYRRLKNAHGAVGRIQQHFRDGRLSVFDADISGFFDSLDHQILIDKVSLLNLDPRAEVLIRRYLKSHRIQASDAKSTDEAIGRQQRYPRLSRAIGVPQGGVLSGILSNLYLAEFDSRIQQEFGGLVRYADDFVVCGNNEENCERIREVVDAELKKLSLELHTGKTETCRPAVSGIEFLGFTIYPDVIRVRPKNISRFKNRVIKVIAKQKRRSEAGRTLSSLCRRLTFKIEGPGPEIMDKLIKLKLADHPYRRSWIGFFRIATDESQIRQLDRWVATQISAYMWRTHRLKVNRADMRNAGLPTLYSTMWKARREPRAKGKRQ